jgi:hypothetical protein
MTSFTFDVKKIEKEDLETLIPFGKIENNKITVSLQYGKTIKVAKRQYKITLRRFSKSKLEKTPIYKRDWVNEVVIKNKKHTEVPRLRLVVDRQVPKLTWFEKEVVLDSLPLEPRIKYGNYWWWWSCHDYQHTQIETVETIFSSNQECQVGHYYGKKTIIDSKDRKDETAYKINKLIYKYVDSRPISGQFWQTVKTDHASRHEILDFSVSKACVRVGQKFAHGHRNKFEEIKPLRPNEYKEKVVYDDEGKFVSREVTYLAYKNQHKIREDVDNFKVEKLEFKNHVAGATKTRDDQNLDYFQQTKVVENPEKVFERFFS